METRKVLHIWREDEEDPLVQEGLYISLTPDGTIKRHLIAGGKEIPLSDTTIAEELIQVTERNFSYLSAVLLTLYESLEHVHNDPDGFSDYRKYVSTVLCEMESQNIVSGTLSRTILSDLDDAAMMHKYQGTDHVLETINRLFNMLDMPNNASYVLDDLCDRIPVDQNYGKDLICSIAATQIFTFTSENTLYSQYFFRSEEDYYLFLLQQYAASDPNIAKCQFCGRYFLPKTRKKTLYCDRIIRDGKTCKQLAPRMKRKELIAADRVRKEFERAKKRQYLRYKRTGPDKITSIIDLTLLEYYAWLTKAADALGAYLAGELSEEDALSIIYVPTKDELTGDNSLELTLETAAT
jgi:hypothetical protein